MNSVPTLLPCLLGAAALTAQQEPPNRSVLEILPLQRLCASQPPLPMPLWATMLARPSDGDAVDLIRVGDNDDQQFAVDTVVEFLHRRYQAHIDNDDLSIESDGASLYVMGKDVLVGEVRAELRELSALVTRPIEVEVSFWRDGDGPAPATTLSPNDYGAFAAAHELLWQRRTTTRSSRPVALESSRWTSYVRDADVEIAQKSAISVPTTAAFFEGAHVLVTPHALVGGDDFVVHTQFTWAERKGPVERTSTGVPDTAQLDAPTVASLCGGCSGRLTNGGALCVTMRGDDALGASGTLTIRVTSRIPPSGQQTARLGVFPVSALTSAALVDRVDPLILHGGNDDPSCLEVLTEEFESGFGMIDIDRLIELIYQSLSEEARETAELLITGGFLFASGSEETIERAGALLLGLQERLLRNVSVQHVDRLVGDGDGDRQGRVLHELLLPSLPGRHLTAVRRLETNIVRDLHVEVAEDAKAVDPVVGLLQTGSWLRARVAPADDRCHLLLRAECTHSRVPESRQMMPQGALRLPSRSAQDITFDGVIGSGQAIDHGDGPQIVTEGDRVCRSEVVTTLRW